jgi:hypothetical protein
LHNAAKTGLKKLDFDIESLILKIYSEFSTSAKRLGELKELFENDNMKFEDILKHIPTRWLSLSFAIDRLIKNWSPIKKYFLDKGEDETPNIVMIMNFMTLKPISVSPCVVIDVHLFLSNS